MNEQIGSGTDAYHREYIAENFQLTLGESISGIRYSDVPQKFPETMGIPRVNLTIIDGELYLLDRGSPPGLTPLSDNAGILLVRE